MGDIALDIENLEKIKKAGIPWVRMDVKKPANESSEIFSEAHKMGLKVIGVVTSRRMLKGLGLGAEEYLPNSNWGRKWKERVGTAVELLGAYVDSWQIDNELNHPWHNPIPSLNPNLAVDIVSMGIDAIKEIDHGAKCAVNLFFKMDIPSFLPIRIPIIRDKPFIQKFRDKLKDKIDILGVDIYRSTWHGGSPDRYPEDMSSLHELWGGDIMIMETGFCTGILGRSEADQENHVREVFGILEDHIENVPWFRGVMWYEFQSSHKGLPCEKFFGLHRDGKEKKAWGEFVKSVNRVKNMDNIVGLTYHY